MRLFDTFNPKLIGNKNILHKIRISNNSNFISKIIFDNSANSTSYTDYQFKIVLNNTNFDFSKAKSDGSNIRFLDSDKSTLLSYWIEKYDYTNQNVIVWIKIPNILPYSVKNIYIKAENNLVTSASNKTSTFIDTIAGTQLALDFDEGSGTIAYDKSGNGNNGTLMLGPTWTNGKFGKALSFDGKDDYVYTSLNLNWTEGTISLYAKAKDLNKRNLCVYTADNATTSNSHQIEFINSGKIQAYIYDYSLEFIDSVMTVAPNNWYHTVITWKNNSYFKLYVNGNLQGSTTIGTVPPNGNKFLIGKRIGNPAPSLTANSFYGLIDEVRVYNTVLTAAQIANLYNNYGYNTVNNPHETLVRKYKSIEPNIVVQRSI